MATTTYHEFDAAARGIGNRTDSAGVAVGDITAEEDRLVQAVITEGAITTDAFVVQATGADMDITVGSGSAKADLFAVAGGVAGQGVYLARLDQTPVSITVPAAEASQVRNDEVYLVIADNAYDAGGVSLPRIGYRKGDAGGAAPGPDSSWQAFALLATVNVTAATTTIDQADITDERATASFTLVPPDLVSTSGADMAGTLTFIDDASETFRLEFGEVSTPERFWVFADDRGYLNIYTDTNGDGTADVASMQVLEDGSVSVPGNTDVASMGPTAVATKQYVDSVAPGRLVDADVQTGNTWATVTLPKAGKTYLVIGTATIFNDANSGFYTRLFLDYPGNNSWMSNEGKGFVQATFQATVTMLWVVTGNLVTSDGQELGLYVNSFSGSMVVQHRELAAFQLD